MPNMTLTQSLGELTLMKVAGDLSDSDFDYFAEELVKQAGILNNILPQSVRNFQQNLGAARKTFNNINEIRGGQDVGLFKRLLGYKRYMDPAKRSKAEALIKGHNYRHNLVEQGRNRAIAALKEANKGSFNINPFTHFHRSNLLGEQISKIENSIPKKRFFETAGHYNKRIGDATSKLHQLRQAQNFEKLKGAGLLGAGGLVASLPFAAYAAGNRN